MLRVFFKLNFRRQNLLPGARQGTFGRHDGRGEAEHPPQPVQRHQKARPGVLASHAGLAGKRLQTHLGSPGE